MRSFRLPLLMRAPNALCSLLIEDFGVRLLLSSTAEASSLGRNLGPYHVMDSWSFGYSTGVSAPLAARILPHAEQETTQRLRK